jgi:hypothetical protein
MISLCLAVTFTLGVYAFPPSDISGKVLESFHRDFPNVQNQSIKTIGNSVVVYFKDDHSSCRVFYDLKGGLIAEIKCYDASELSPFIRSRVDEKFPGKDISSITEVTSQNEHYYEINVQGIKVWYQIKYDINGTIKIQKKWHKAWLVFPVLFKWHKCINRLCCFFCVCYPIVLTRFKI